MGKRVNRYRFKTPNLTIETSLPVEKCEGKTDLEIAVMILRNSRMFRTAKDIEGATRSFDLKLLR